MHLFELFEFRKKKIHRFKPDLFASNALILHVRGNVKTFCFT